MSPASANPLLFDSFLHSSVLRVSLRCPRRRKGRSIGLYYPSCAVAGGGGGRARFRVETPFFDICTLQPFHMAPLLGISSTLFSRSKPYYAPLSQLLFLRSMSSKIFVKGLAFSTTEEKLAEAFSQYGSVLKADIILNARNRSKGFGYVTFAKEEEALKAQMAMNGKILHGRVLYVDMQPPMKQNRLLLKRRLMLK